MTPRIRLLLTLLLPSASVAMAQSDNAQQLDVRPAIVASLESTTFKQEKVADCVAAGTGLQWNGTTISYSSEGLSLSGTDRNGGTWNAVVPAGNVLTCEVWASKLYKGSTGDLLIMNRGQGDGGYESELTILSFDSQGRPLPWRGMGAFTITKDGIAQVVKTGTDSSANLIVPKREGDRHDGYAYVHELVSVNQNGMAKIVGPKYASTWPLITGNRKALTGTESNDTLSENREASLPRESATTLRSVTAPSAQPPVLGGITLSDGTSSMFPSMLVVDSDQSTRKIYFDGDVPDALSKMTKGTYAVKLTGQSCEEEECRPLLMVATQR